MIIHYIEIIEQNELYLYDFKIYKTALMHALRVYLDAKEYENARFYLIKCMLLHNKTSGPLQALSIYVMHF